MKLPKFTLIFLTIILSLTANAQDEVNRQDMPVEKQSLSSAPFAPSFLKADSLHLYTAPLENVQLSRNVKGYTMPAAISAHQFNLHTNTRVAISGLNSQMVGLMDVATSTISLHQDFGRLHLSALAISNKYWMPMQHNLYSQYGLGGTISYNISEAISLHAFGYYYAGKPLVAPALSPYVSTTSFGGYANIQLNEHFGSSIGVHRYISPMSGRWTTAPIVTPYVKIGKMAIGFPIGDLIKTWIWGDQDNPLRFKPQPQPQPGDNKRSRSRR